MDTLVKGIEEEVLKFWHQGMMPLTIAQKLNLAQDKVEDIIEAPGNYLSYEALIKLCDF